MKRNGFTLVELLAVIVILAIIALIAVPLVLNIISDSKNAAILRSAEFYKSAVENAIVEENINSTISFNPTMCKVEEDGKLFCDESRRIVVKVKGEKPTAGVIFFENGRIISLELVYNDIIIKQDYEGNLIESDSRSYYYDDNIVYFDVQKGETCNLSEYNPDNSKTGYNGINDKNENQTSCLKFYLINDDGYTVDLLLDHNTTAKVAWNSSKTFVNGPNEVLIQLNSDTKDWNGTIEPSSVTESDEEISYTVNYSNYKARLITVKEIANITKNVTWNYDPYYHFDSRTSRAATDCTEGNTSGCQYSWLYDRTSTTCKKYGCINNSDTETSGYWTSSAFFSKSPAASHQQECNGEVGYGVSNKSRIGYVCVSQADHYGVRPVITVEREKILGNNHVICKATTEETKTTGNVPTGLYKDGEEYICKVNSTSSYHFFVVGTTSDKVNLILDRNINIDGTLADVYRDQFQNKIYNLTEWVSLDDYVSAGGMSSSFGSNGKADKGPLTALNFVQTATDTWTDIPNMNEIYTDENLNDNGIKGSNGYGSISLTGKARLPKFEEVVGPGKCQRLSGVCPLWQVNYLKKGDYTEKDGFVELNSVYGYWTLSSSQSGGAWIVRFQNGGSYIKMTHTTAIGIRPVITIPKENIG